MAQQDDKHRIFFTVYRSIMIQYDQLAFQMFGEFAKKVEFVEAKIKSLKRPSVDTLRKLLHSLLESLDEIIPMPSNLSRAIHASITSSIRALLESPVASKKEALSIVSTIRKLFTPKTQEYYSAMLKAALIFSQKFLVEV